MLIEQFEVLAARLRTTLSTTVDALNPTLRAEREEALIEIDAINSEVLDFDFKALALDQEAPAYDNRCPYLGLAAFRIENSAFFFGREPLVTRLVYRLADHNFLAVLGGSGSGKSSLVLAVLFPRSQSQNPDLAVCYLTPTSNPAAQLNRILAEEIDEGQVIVVDQFEELFTLCTEEAHASNFWIAF